ncbi:DODA-type extradiol aromatic ring-opening family dioxygenase [Methylophilus aquaticus]|uniref:Class III extradiol ring-cleavage dioxygenase n=1 Tax=Methylophilus aquaticus TaxID=1971610 RepID=A0ABT9JPE1_9PROT|nr:class III extradiol ring-cleavage dioxygenase [Methylophilus aquaticus]MDP8566446.1 class III extradiol ring-cleavage dioxygenase [Methylophilus aquaticus]
MTTVFVSHGAPMLAVEPGQTGVMLAELAKTMPKPDAILCVSAHWDTRVPTVSTAPEMETIHDFSGFPQALFEIQYAAKGAPLLAARVVECLQAAQISVHTHATRGLDHGAWVTLSLMYPQAEIPVTQLSIQSRASTASQCALGRALQPLHAENILILASGAVTHNLGDFFSPERDAAALPYVQAFADWVGQTIAEEDVDQLLFYRQQSAHGARAHPTEDHLMPLFVALGAAGASKVRRLQPELTYGILAMDAYLWL